MTDTDRRCFARKTSRTASGSDGSGTSTTSLGFAGGGSIGRSSATSRIVVGSGDQGRLFICALRGLAARGRVQACRE